MIDKILAKARELCCARAKATQSRLKSVHGGYGCEPALLDTENISYDGHALPLKLDDEECDFFALAANTTPMLVAYLEHVVAQNTRLKDALQNCAGVADDTNHNDVQKVVDRNAASVKADDDAFADLAAKNGWV